MNSSTQNDPEAIRSDIDATRQKMDNTMTAIGNRLQPQHLLDEVLGFFRGSSDNGENRLSEVRQKITQSCDTAMHAVTDTVKKNPVPALLIGAGIAWMIYESRREKSGNGYSDDQSFDRNSRASFRDPDLYGDEPLDYPSPVSSRSERSDGDESKLGNFASSIGDKASAVKDQVKDTAASLTDQVKDKAAAVTDQVKDTLSNAGEAVREKTAALRQRANEVTANVKDGTRRIYNRTREQAVATVDHHPLELGFAALAAGVVGGLLLPTPDAVNRAVGPTADKLRDRTREAGVEMLEKGKRVAEAATSAVKEEAEAQGMTADNLRDKVTAVVDRAKEATKDSAHREGLSTDNKNPPDKPVGTV